jgi:hypothetical protein
VNQFEFDVSVGDVLCLGNRTVTVVDIDGPNVSFQVDRDDDFVAAAVGGAHAASISLGETD